MHILVHFDQFGNLLESLMLAKPIHPSQSLVCITFIGRKREKCLISQFFLQLHLVLTSLVLLFLYILIVISLNSDYEEKLRQCLIEGKPCLKIPQGLAILMNVTIMIMIENKLTKLNAVSIVRVKEQH